MNKILCMDQSAIRRIMEVLSPDYKEHKRVGADPFWTKHFATVSLVRNVQIVFFPDSRETSR